ncbi:hypothetical protein SAMN05216207_102477 [Pseudonocardia ammonioxydans]|uniref:Excreted virulence factor EspC, type VII ESX diderm n=1 Tax=Pseudonocardia ammonioxydans TaxID=260086 RepID=A0A1I5CXZ9_PSUAM|nr:hypothetical protein [Pseudonocardia ammonioxydans]SFN91875.1 hypothetical protein SAMN05216207_102477 [Pseudonocardia ammonioxydans]
MRPDLRYDPAALDRAAGRLRDLAAGLREDAGPVAGREHAAVAHRIADELDSLADAAGRAAGRIRDADDTAAARIRGYASG